jgi:polyhydroxybutyrate depolymerase
MKRVPLTACVILAVSILLPALPVSAQDGPIRQRLKERRAQREQEKSGNHADTGTQMTKAGDFEFATQHGGEVRKYRIHVPASFAPAKPAPLLFALHGGGGNMDFQANDARYGLISASEKEGFVVVFPNGYSERRGGRLATWNAGNCCGDARDDNSDDVGFIRRIVDEVTARMNIDRNRIYATGMSNGAMMAYRLACEMSDVFKGIAAVAGTDNTRSCNPRNPVSVLHIHAKDDDHVLFNGGAGPQVHGKANVTDFASVPDTVAKWTQLNGCNATPKRILEKDGAYCEVYFPCKDKAEVQLCVTDSGGHSWPGAARTRGEPASQAISANEVMWDFFTRH